MDIKHIVALMLENRSFDCMLGTLYPSNEKSDALTATEFNAWRKSDGSHQKLARELGIAVPAPLRLTPSRARFRWPYGPILPGLNNRTSVA